MSTDKKPEMRAVPMNGNNAATIAYTQYTLKPDNPSTFAYIQSNRPNAPHRKMMHKAYNTNATHLPANQLTYRDWETDRKSVV